MAPATAHRRRGKIRPDVGASLAAGLADEARLQIGEPDVIRPWVCADRYRVAVAIICAIDQETVHARGAHFAEGNFLRAGHAPLKRRRIG
jgi:hypothetical protein